MALHDVGRPARHAEAAVDGGLRLAHEVGERGGHGRRHRPPCRVSQADEAVAHQVGLVVDPGGVVLDEPHLPAPPVVMAQDGAVGRRHLGPLGQRLADEGAVGGDVLLGELSVLGVGEVPVEEEGQVGVEGVPVQSDGLLELAIVGQHRASSTSWAGTRRTPRGSLRPFARSYRGALSGERRYGRRRTARHGPGASQGH